MQLSGMCGTISKTGWQCSAGCVPWMYRSWSGGLTLLAEIGITSNIEHYRCIKHPLWEMKAGALRAMFF